MSKINPIKYLWNILLTDCPSQSSRSPSSAAPAFGPASEWRPTARGGSPAATASLCANTHTCTCRVPATQNTEKSRTPIVMSISRTRSDRSPTHHKQFLPRFRPFAQHLRALGDDWIDARRVLDVNVRARKQTNGARFARTSAAQPRTKLLQDLHRIADVQVESVRHLAVPVVDGCAVIVFGGDTEWWEPRQLMFGMFVICSGWSFSSEFGIKHKRFGCFEASSASAIWVRVHWNLNATKNNCCKYWIFSTTFYVEPINCSCISKLFFYFIVLFMWKFLRLFDDSSERWTGHRCISYLATDMNLAM